VVPTATLRRLCSRRVPPLDPLRIGEHLHGHLGWLAVLALAHPAILLRNHRRRAHLSVGLAVGISTLAAALGVWLYGPYRTLVRRAIFASAPGMGYLFERKEHLAFGAILLAWAGAVAYVGAIPASGEVRESLRKVAHRAFVLSAMCALTAAALGTVVATYRTF
jgi:hypothetical protein